MATPVRPKRLSRKKCKDKRQCSSSKCNISNNKFSSNSSMFSNNILIYLIRYNKSDLLYFVIVVLEEANFIKSQYGNAMLVDGQGYRYVQNGSSKTSIFWRCIYYGKSKGTCPGKAVTKGFDITKKAEHKHEPNVPIVPSKRRLKQLEKENK